MTKPFHALIAIVFGITIIGYQGNLASYFIPGLETHTYFRPVYYGFWFVLGIAVFGASILRPNIRSLEWPAIVFCIFSASLVLFHPIDHVAKSFIVSMGLFFAVVLLTTFCESRKVAFTSAAVTAFSAVFCLIDIMMPHGFTNTAGRAAGLAEGPNLAAAQLLLGATVVWRTLYKPFRAPFLILVGFASFATLSRSSLAVAFAATLIAAVPFTFKKTNKDTGHITTVGHNLISVGLALGLLGWILLALVANDRFSVAAETTYQSLGQARTAIIKTVDLITMNVTTPRGQAASEHRGELKYIPRDDELKRLNQEVKTEGQIDSAAHRQLLFQRAMIRYSESPPGGLGLLEAHELAPHNSYLLFALAFGGIGLLVPLGLCALLVRAAIVSMAWEVPAAAAVLLFLSHDLLLAPSTIVLFAIGSCPLHSQHQDEDSNRRRVKLQGRLDRFAVK